MRYRSGLLAIVAAAWLGSAAQAQLFWNPLNFDGAPVHGDEPGIGLPLPDATPAEVDANLLWNMRAGLNVAALQCQFAPALMTVRNYNEVIRHHSAEFTKAYTTLGGYFKRIAGKKNAAAAQTALDQYTTRTYNGFSTMYAQRGFCQTASSIGRDALSQPKGSLLVTARNRMREFRNSLVPYAERVVPAFAMPPVEMPDICHDARGKLLKFCRLKR